MGTINFTQILSATLVLLSIIDIVGSIPIILQLREKGRHVDAVKATLYSTLLPGAGKVYAGRLGEGIASFLAVGTLGLATWDHARKDGISHWTTLALGSLCAYFYIGNIYGSYVSVSLYNQDLRNAQDTAILYHIHIPLRSLFR